MFCRNCGNKIEDGNQWCTSCGSNNNVPTKVNLNKKGKVTPISIIVIVAILGLGFVFWGSKSNFMIKRNTPEGAVESFFAAINKGDLMKALEYTNVKEEYPEEYKDILIEMVDSDFKKQFAVLCKLIKLESVVVTDRDWDSCNVLVVVKMLNEVENGEIKVIKSNGKWKIDFYDSTDMINYF